VSEHELIEIATSIESKSEHPLAKAIMNYAGNNNISTREITDFITLPGNGLKGKLQGVDIVAGSYKFIKENHSLNENVKKTVDELSEQGKTPMLFVKDGKYIGIIAVADTIKEDSYKGVNELKNMGIKVVMITGDNPKTAKAIASKAGVDHVVAGVLPDGKEKVIIELQKYGKVAMVGDGINDALALTRADIGIAIGAGTDVAIDAADIVLMKSRLSDVSAAIRLSRQTIKNIHENLFWAFFYNVICIPLAAGFYSAIFGWQFEMNPMVGAAAMSLSSFTVCMNALRLNLFKDVENKYNNKEDVMTKTVKIEGMMCEHCEARVKKTLEALEGIESATPNHKEDVAVIELSKDVDEEVIKKAIEDQDYKYIGIE
ncbi:MAG: HAD-IC family P-type ATPase, partial [Lachnospiraceae bacterium]|nr:HAD-IC family P-type ATPase [Lachnospiraceae bacterium]